MASFFEKILFIYLRHRARRAREREHEWKEGEAEGERKADAPWSREPDTGLDPRTLRS